MPNINAIHLYRSLLKAHKKQLPLHMRVLGDAYVRQEFKRHKAAEEKFVNLFMQEWRNYLNELNKGQQGTKVLKKKGGAS